MKKLKDNKVLMYGAMALVVVMVGALALTLNGSSFQGYLGKVSSDRMGSLRPISAEPLPAARYHINLKSPVDNYQATAKESLRFTWDSNVPSNNGYSLNFNCSQNGYPNVSIDSYGFMQNSWGLTPVEAPGLFATLNASEFYSQYLAATYKEAAVDPTKPVYCLWNVNSSPQVYIASKQTWHLKINPAK